jgi:mitotic-spindle organizing protein 1
MASSNSSSSHLQSSQILAAKETFSLLQDISQLLNTGLDSESLAICVKLCENGVNPEALATVIRELRKQSEAIKREEEEENLPTTTQL